MAINFDMTDVDPEKVGKGFQAVKPGKAHVMITDAKEHGGKNQEHIIEYTVYAHTDPSQVGLKHSEYYGTAPNLQWKFAPVLLAAGLVDREDMKRRKAAGQAMLPINLLDAIGKQMFCTFTENEHNGKTYTHADYVLCLNDPAAEKHPRDARMFSQATGQQSVPVMPQANTAPAATVQPAQHAPAQVTRNPFANMATAAK